MIVTTTAISFIMLSFGLAFCGWRFWKAFSENDNLGSGHKVGVLLSSLFFATALHNGSLGLGALFFGRSPDALVFVLIIAHFFLTIFTILSVYTVRYIFFPKMSLKFIFIIVGILSLTGFLVIFLSHPQPLMTQQGQIDWAMGSLLSLVTFLLFLLSLSSVFYIFSQLFLKVKIREIKLLSLFIAVIAIAGIINVFMRLILFNNIAVTTRSRILDVIVGFLGVLLLLGLVVVPVIFSRAKNLRESLKNIEK